MTSFLLFPWQELENHFIKEKKKKAKSDIFLQRSQEWYGKIM